MDDRLRDALRAEAARHRPDREAILARVAAGQSPEWRARAGAGAGAGARARAGARGRRTRLRPAALVATCALLLGASVAGTWAAVGHYTAPQPQGAATVTTPAGGPSQEPSPSRTGSGSGSGSGSGGVANPAPTTAGTPATTPPTATSSASASQLPASQSPGSQPPGSQPPVSQSPGPTRVQQGFLWSDGSVDPGSTSAWAQSDVTLKTRFTVSALDVTLRVALTPGVADTGNWSTVPAQDLTVTVTRQAGFLLYEWTLKPGVTLAPGTYAFAGQYDHASGGRDAGQDTYAATATGHGQPASVYGDFYATAH